jgi:hypothetical protein
MVNSMTVTSRKAAFEPMIRMAGQMNILLLPATTHYRHGSRLP